MAELGARPIPRLAFHDWLAPIMGSALFAAALLKGAAVLGDPDIQWHIAAGRWIAAHGVVPGADPFSHTLRGAPWHAHEWLAELIFWWVFRMGGWSAVALVAAGAAGLAFALLAGCLQRYLQPRHVLLLCAASFAVASQHLLARPHILTWPMLVLWTSVLMAAAERRTAPHPGWLLLMALWANIHGGYVFGLALAGVFACEALLASERQARAGLFRGWALFVAGAGLASLVTPHGPLAGIAFAVGFLDAQGFVAPIGEWQPADFRTLSGLQLALLALLAIALSGRLRLPPLRILLIVALVHLALAHVRHGELLGLVAPLALAAPLAASLYGGASRAGERSPAGGRRAGTAAVTALVSLLAGSFAVARSEPQPPAAVAPRAALEAVRSAGLIGEAGLNAFDFGGFLIASGVPVFIDGRADFYGGPYLRGYLEAMSLSRPGALEEVLADHAIGWTMLQPGTPAVGALDRLPGWERLHADETAVVHRRSAAR